MKKTVPKLEVKMLPHLAKTGNFAVITNAIRLGQLYIFTGTLVKMLGPNGKKTKPFRVKAVYPDAGDKDLIFDVSARDLFALQKKPGQLLLELLQTFRLPICVKGLYVLNLAKIFEAVHNSPSGNGRIKEKGFAPHFPFAINSYIVSDLLKYGICVREGQEENATLIFPRLIKDKN